MTTSELKGNAKVIKEAKVLLQLAKKHRLKIKIVERDGRVTLLMSVADLGGFERDLGMAEALVGSQSARTGAKRLATRNEEAARKPVRASIQRIRGLVSLYLDKPARDKKGNRIVLSPEEKAVRKEIKRQFGVGQKAPALTTRLLHVSDSVLNAWKVPAQKKIAIKAKVSQKMITDLAKARAALSRFDVAQGEAMSNRSTGTGTAKAAIAAVRADVASIRRAVGLSTALSDEQKALFGVDPRRGGRPRRRGSEGSDGDTPPESGGDAKSSDASTQAKP